MALTKCRECGHDVSKKAKVCPSCGAPVGPKQYSVGQLLLVLFVGALIYFVYRSASADEAPTYKSQRVSAADFPGTWPFTVPEGVLSCRERDSVVLEVGRKLYGINGVAKSEGYLSPDPIWRLARDDQERVAQSAEEYNVTAEQARQLLGEIRISIGPIIDAGLKLCR